MLILPYLDCLLCDHCARCFPCVSHIWCYSLGLWLSILTVRLWISKALSPTLIPKARLAGINLPLQEPHLLGHPSVSKAFFRFPSWNRWKQRGRKKSLLWAGTGLGKGGFRHIKLRGTKGLPRGWGPHCCFAWMRALRIEWRGPADLRQGCFRLEQGWEAVPSSSGLSRPMACLSVRIRDRSQIHMLSSWKSDRRHEFKAQSVTDFLWDLGKG